MNTTNNKIKNVPNLRFPGFEGEWEKKKLKEVCIVNPTKSSLPDFFIYINLESVSNGILLKEDEVSKIEAPSRAQRVLDKEDILFQMVRPYQMNNLFFNKDGEYVASTGYAQLKSQQVPKFIYYYLHYPKFVNKVIRKCTGTSYPAISSADLSVIEIGIPISTEQLKVSNFLNLLDMKIQTQNKIIEKLESLNQGLRQQVFSQRIRFKDIHGKEFPDWKERKLNSICRKTSSNISANKIKDISGSYKVYGATGYLQNIDFYQEEEPYIAIVKDGAGVGRTFLCEQKSSVLGTLDKVLSKNGNDLYFLYLSLTNIKFQKYITGSTIPHIYFKDYSKEKVKIPRKEEQTKIAHFFTAIDQKIEKEKAILDRYKEQKQYLLQDLFI